MTEAADQYRRRADRFQAVIEGTPADRWPSPSPCAGWLASDVVAHVVDFSAQVLTEKAGMHDPPLFAHFQAPGQAFGATRALLERILDDPATPPKVATHLVWSLSFDLPQHTWDLAAATGQDTTMDPDEVGLLWGSLNGVPQQWEWQRANGWYGTPVPVPADATLQDRVLGLLGRDPRWQRSA